MEVQVSWLLSPIALLSPPGVASRPCPSIRELLQAPWPALSVQLTSCLVPPSPQVVAEEEQQFLARQQQLLAQGLPPQQAGAMPTGASTPHPGPFLLFLK